MGGVSSVDEPCVPGTTHAERLSAARAVAGDDRDAATGTVVEDGHRQLKLCHGPSACFEAC